MTLYLLDTHVLYWHLFAPANLSAAAKEAITEGEGTSGRLAVSHVVLAELFFLLKKLGQDSRFSHVVASIRSHPNYGIEPVTLEDIENLPQYTEVPEMHDRLLVAQTNRLGATLISKDQVIQACSQAKSLW